jgi:hypothetical protein
VIRAWLAKVWAQLTDVNNWLAGGSSVGPPSTGYMTAFGTTIYQRVGWRVNLFGFGFIKK